MDTAEMLLTVLYSSQISRENAMKALLAGCAALAVLCSANATYAADMARPAPVYKAPPIVAPPAYSWTGIYLGLEGGGGWGRENYGDNTLSALPTSPVSQRPDGGIFGGVLGYRYQIGQWVLGVEGSAAWAHLDSTATSGVFTENFKTRALYTATGQVGWAFDRALLYAKGGWAGVSVNNFLSGAGGTASNTQTDSGWTAGVGLDYAAWQNIVLGVEYDYIDVGYGGYTAPFSLGGAPWLVGNTSRFTIDQVVGRLTYKFNMP